MKWTKFFICSSGMILLAAAVIRFFIAADHAPALALPEPMLGFPLRNTVWLVGGFELVVALICLFGKRAGIQMCWLAWLATNFLVYQIGLFWMHCHPQASCIGSLTDPLHLSRGTSGLIVGILPFYLLLGSYSGVAWLWLQESRARETIATLKMSCPACGVHIKFARANLGRQILCPQCQAGIALRQPDLLKMSCFFCQEHIEFPTHAIGEKIACPHCRMDITLKEQI